MSATTFSGTPTFSNAVTTVFRREWNTCCRPKPNAVLNFPKHLPTPGRARLSAAFQLAESRSKQYVVSNRTASWTAQRTPGSALPDNRNTDLEAIRHALEKELAELTDMREAAEEARRPVELDQQSVGRLSRMDAMQVQAMANAVETRRQSRAAQLKAALRRLDEDEFGCCVGCGEEIPPKRLETDLTIARCVNCTR